ncbi:MAG: hypothetical protein SFY69_01865 [Planctomycetota bacterium]|nr:hypothetical protein [Planctomycetota bacterium]
MSLPIGDWQFWVVTVLALLGAAFVLREVLPARINPLKRRRGEKKTTLTIEGKTPGPSRDRSGAR